MNCVYDPMVVFAATPCEATNNLNNSYDNLDYTESDRKGRAVCQIWLQGGIHNETPTDKNLSGQESHDR